MTLTHRNRFAILWIIAQVPGVNRLEASIVKTIREKLEALDMETPPDARTADIVWGTREFEKAETEFLLISINSHWDSKRIPATLSDMMLSVEEMLKA